MSANRGAVKPGEVRNPSGRNQYTYRRDFEADFARILAGDLSPKLAKKIPADLRAVIPAGATLSEAFVWLVVVRALSGDGRALSEALKRLWPVPRDAHDGGNAARDEEASEEEQHRAQIEEVMRRCTDEELDELAATGKRREQILRAAAARTERPDA